MATSRPEESPTRLYPEAVKDGNFNDVKSALEDVGITWHDAGLPGVEFGNITVK